MTNKEIASYFNILVNLMELHNENPFKIRTYQFAYRSIRNHHSDLAELGKEEIQTIDGIGKAVAEKIHEIVSTGELSAINKLMEVTPVGIVEMLKLKGIGPKKIKMIWEQLEIESPVELMYAINENRLIELKGFGPKIQENLRIQLEYLLESRDKFHYASLEKFALELEAKLIKQFPDEMISLCGEIRRKCQELSSIDILITLKLRNEELIAALNDERLTLVDDQIYLGHVPVNIFKSSRSGFYYNLVKQTCAYEYFKAIKFKAISADSEREIFETANLPYVIPEMRELENINRPAQDFEGDFVRDEDIKGVVHSHTLYSDGGSTVAEMAEASKELGYDYLVITDHSKAAFYANGLKEDRIEEQLLEISETNKNIQDFRIFSGIEADILSDGSLDYDHDTRAKLDVIIASVHSNLNMDEEKATTRILKAVENPQTHILGHPTGRLILSRKGYPLDHYKIIDACSANGVAIEINANPYRLDIDWRWIDYCMKKSVLLSINPDAHSIKGIQDIHFGVCAARKGGLRLESCLNAFTTAQFSDWLSKK